MAVRIKHHWHRETLARSDEAVGSAIAFNGWKLAMERAINLHHLRFSYRDDRQRLAVIAEYLIFELQLVDRIAHQTLEGSRRADLVTAVAQKMADYLQENSVDLLGPGEHRETFIDRVNRRAGEYAEFHFDEQGPAYPFYRHLGHTIQQLMGSGGENRWVIDQVMDIDGPQLFQRFRPLLRDLLT